MASAAVPRSSLFLEDGRVAIDNNPAERAPQTYWNRKKELVIRGG